MMHYYTIYSFIGRVNHFKNHNVLSAILWLHVQLPNDTKEPVRVPLRTVSTENSVSVEFKQSEVKKTIKAPPTPELPA